MSDSLTLNSKNSGIAKEKSIFKDVFFWLLLVCIELVFLRVSFWRFLGPIMACIFAYLYFIRKDTLLVTMFIVLAHYELKAVLISTVSFPQLLIVFLCYEIISKKEWNVTATSLTTGILAVCMTVIPWLYGSITGEDVFYLLVYIFAILIQCGKYKDDKDNLAQQLSLAISVIVTLIALHAVITGGVEYADMDDAEIIRRGVLGAGIGDPNFSCLLLSTGIVSALNCKKIYLWARIVMICLMLGAVVVTVSTTGLLALGVIAIVHALNSSKLTHKIRNVVIILLLVVIATQVYMSLPEKYRNEGIDSYVTRVDDKYQALTQGDYTKVTTNRTDISERYLNYINNGQSFLKTLFGGNSVVPKAFVSRAISHITYIDFLVQYGYVGTFLILLFIAYHFKKQYGNKEFMQYRNFAISMKILYLFFAFSISIYKESTFAMLFFTLFIL